MRKYLLAGAAAISMAALPGIGLAQADTADTADTASAAQAGAMTAEQQAEYDAWPADRRADYDAWSADDQTYFWTLDPERQEGYWALTPEQRTRIRGMTPAQQEQAWESIAAQLSGEPAAATTQNPASATSGTTGSQAGTTGSGTTGSQASAPAAAGTADDAIVRYETNEVVQQGVTRQQPDEYPVCRGEVQDSCINPRAAGMNWGNRPLDHWPGQPASSM